MPHDLTAVPQFTAAPITLPNDGETDEIGSIEGAFQKLDDRTSFLLLGVSGALAWSGDFGVRKDGSSTSFTLDVGAIQSLVLQSEAGGTYDVYNYFGGTITEAKLEFAGALAPSTVYYVYAKPGVGGVCDFEISAAPPRANRVFKSPVTTLTYARRYLAFFATDASGNPIPVRASRGRYVYRLSASTTQARVLNTSVLVGTNADLSLAPLVPPHARLARLFVNVAAGGGQLATFSLYAKPDTASVQHLVQPADGTLVTALVDVETDASQVVQYRLTSGGGGGTANALVYVASVQE